MGWEKRGNRRYYYVKRRQSGRVISNYYGCGPLAEGLAMLDELDRLERDLEQRRWAAERQTYLAADRQLRHIAQLLRDLQAAALIAHGYHTHRRQWRRRRHESE